MALVRLAIAALLIFGLSACGTYVPQLTDVPDDEDESKADLMVQAIVRSFRCELRRAVTEAIGDDVASAHANQDRTYADFLNNWGAQVALTLTIAEKTVVNPTTILTPATPANAIFTLSGGILLSAQATRTEKLNFFYTVHELYLWPGEECDASGELRHGSLLVQNDLKIAPTLSARISAIALGQANVPGAGQQNVLSHQVTFQVISSGNITPTLRLVRSTINPTGTFLGASRDRTHDLLITFGPLDKPHGGKSLIAIAEQSHFASQITSGISNGFDAALAR